MKKYIVILLAIMSYSAFAQTKTEEMPAVVFKGKLTFERKINLHKQMDAFMKSRPEMASMVDNMKKQIPKYRTDQFELFFTENHSLYKPAPDGITETKSMMANLPSEKNIVYNDYEKEIYTAEKNIFDKVYLVQDSMKKFDWKITEEFRKVAGFNCRRAETVIMDSIYVIAFYTDAILAKGGPENFCGLPGMIMGIVMPRLNITYFATGYENFLKDETQVAAPVKGTKKSSKELTSDIQESTKQWGEFAQKILWYINI